MAETAPTRSMTVREFFAFDDGTDTRHELIDGQLVAMYPPAPPHVRIGMNVYDALARQLQRPCRAYMGGGVWISEDDRTWREPDIFVSCSAGDDFSVAPRLIVEVLSPSTEKEDRTRKLDFYRRFPSLEAVLLIWQDTRRVEVQERDDARWVLRDVIGNGVVRLETLRLEVGLDEVYAD